MHRNTLFTQVTIICVLALLATTSVVNATPVTSPAEKALSSLLSAIEAGDYDRFVVNGTPSFKAGITKQMFEGVSVLMISRLKTGYQSHYLGNLKQQGTEVSLWKITYKDEGDDTLAKLALQDGKVAGFLLQ